MLRRRLGFAVGLTGLVGLLLLVGFSERLVAKLGVAMMQPSGTFAASPHPAPPDYHQPAMWSALPDRPDVADVELPAWPAPTPASAINQQLAPADVFYVHPTTYIGSGWNGPVDDARLNADTDRVATRLQASAFNACCAVYAPRYRQANGTAFYRPSPSASDDGQKALDLAYADVRTAFHHYLGQHPGRPFVIAAHSQGSVLAYRLLREEIAGKPLRIQLVAAYLIGATLTVEGVHKSLPDVPICATPEQTGCVIGWNARGPHNQPGDFEMTLPLDPAPVPPSPAGPAGPANPASVRLCVNPLTFRFDEEPAAQSQNQGALFWDAPKPEVLPHFASAHCQAGTLIVNLAGQPPRDFMSRILDRTLGAENYHPIEYQLFYGNLRHNAKVRVEAYLRTHSGIAPHN